MEEQGKIFIGKSFKPSGQPVKGEYLELKLANRHGLITGATGTGKTVSLQVLAEGFSRAGVPVFCADIKGDLSGIAMTGVSKDFLEKRAADVGLSEVDYRAFPVVFWDLYGEQGHPVRATVADMGPLLLSRLLELNETQEGVVNIAFKVARDEKIPLVTLTNLRELINHIANRADELQASHGNIAKASVGAIQRRLLVLEEQGANNFFGKPALDINDFMRKDSNGHGTINVLMADKLMSSPRLYSTFLLWMLSQLFDKLPEVGDPAKPKLVFFFDEAHLLFSEAPKALLENIERVTRLIRSKGVGVYYVTQNPLDVPDKVSAQLGNRLQHALRAYTPREQKAVRAAAETFRDNPDINEAEVIMQLKVGEALVSTLHDKGEPSMVQRTLVRPPSSRLGPLTAEERMKLVENSPLSGKYDEREKDPEGVKEAEASAGGIWGSLKDSIFGTGGGGGRSRDRMGMGEAFGKSLTRSIASGVARAIVRSIIGGRR